MSAIKDSSRSAKLAAFKKRVAASKNKEDARRAELAAMAKKLAEMASEKDALKQANETKMSSHTSRLAELGVMTIDLPTIDKMDTIIPMVQTILDKRKRFIIHVSRYQDDPREVADVPDALAVHVIAYRNYGLLALIACQDLLGIAPAELPGTEFFNEAGNIVGIRSPPNKDVRRKVAILPDKVTELLTESMNALWRVYKMPIDMPDLKTFVPITLKRMSRLLEEENGAPATPTDAELTARGEELRKKQELKIYRRRAKRQRQNARDKPAAKDVKN